ncbi:uncharacterized protein LOC128985941 isoform X2 [Macrosteles quadrilineatus]|uniref:uncharacterized protein LOC128985941 isoform X2 n=1 Tax=Macrosteles quadrilineatus TaxID=74068 RepID=UPI0023E346B2|nr:uncharacterized protein LOC128985941 isoform X2 [Macrosteles quadrilineatus]
MDSSAGFRRSKQSEIKNEKENPRTSSGLASQRSFSEVLVRGNKLDEKCVKGYTDSSKNPKGSKQSELKNERENLRTSSGDSSQRNAVLFSDKVRGNKVDKEVPKPPLVRPIYPKFSKTCWSQSKTPTHKEETKEEKKSRLIKQLQKFDSPFKWKPREVKPISEPEVIIERIQEKDKELVDERKFKWRKFLLHLVISYEYWRAKNISKAFEEVCGLESLLNNESNHRDNLFSCIEDALKHVVYASKAFLYLEQNMLTEAEKCIDMILPKDAMNRSNKSGIHGITAGVLMEYGHRGNKYALAEASKAKVIDHSIAEWHFFISKCMGRLRRVAQCHDLVDRTEVTAINKALDLDKGNATYKVFLGQVLAEKTLREYKHHPKIEPELNNKIKKTNHAAMKNFEEAVEMRPKDPHILIRCAKGLMKLPYRNKKLKFTKECIDKALELAPNNPMVHHVQAMYHQRYDCDHELELKAYERAASLNNFGASLDLIKLHHELQTGDILEELEMVATKYEQTERVQVVYTQAGSYLLFIKKDFVGALKYYLKVIEMDKMSYAMKSHKPLFLRLKNPVNMFQILINELAAEKTDWRSFSPEERKVLKDVRIKLMDYKPPEGATGPTTVEEVLKKAEEHMLPRKRKQKRKQKSGKKWCGKKKSVAKAKVKKDFCDGEKLNPKFINNSRSPVSENRNLNTQNNHKRYSISSCSSVDSSYLRDSTTFGPRASCLQTSNENLYGAQSERTLDQKFSRESGDLNGKRYYENRKFSRDLSNSSRSSINSVHSGFVCRPEKLNNWIPSPAKSTEGSLLTADNVNKFEQSYDKSIRSLSQLSLTDSLYNEVQTPNSTEGSLLTADDVNKFEKACDNSIRRLSQLSLTDSLHNEAQSAANSTEESLLTADNVTKFEQSYGNSIRRLSMLSISDVSVGSQDSISTLSVMDRVKQSYAMLGRNNERQSNAKKNKNFNKFGSTQSLNLQKSDDCKRNLGSSGSLNKFEDSNLKRRLNSRDSSVESTRSFSFMPSFAKKKSESDL